MRPCAIDSICVTGAGWNTNSSLGVPSVTARLLLKHSIAGLLWLGQLLQLCLVALQLALLASPASSQAAAYSVICEAHGAVAPDPSDAPVQDGHRAGCVFCPISGHAGVAPIAAPAVNASTVIFALVPAWIPTVVDDTRSALSQGKPPPSRGPPV